MKKIKRKTPYTITDVLNRILEVGITRRKGIQEQKYKLDEKVAEKYKNLKAPEFHITRCTLFEALLQVGGYIHAIPRLLWNESENKANIITFDELGGSEEYQQPEAKLFNLAGYTNYQGIDEYCGVIDSYVDNIINTTDSLMGSIYEPCKTPRCEEGEYEISNNTSIISTDYPIYRLISLEATLKDKEEKYKTYDLTPYVYEQAEYSTLTSYEGQYPYAKKYALKYVQGQENITGLSFVHKSVFNLKDTSLANILKRVGAETPNFKDITFRVSYIPIISARVKQMKVYDDFPTDNALLYNQSANTVESNYYGEHLKGVIAKLGNEVETQTYYIFRYNKLPKCGQLFQGKYISKIEREFNFKYVKVTLTLTPNFNKLAEYIGVNSNYRLYDVSEKQSVDRAINYSDILYIGDNIDNEPDKIAYNGLGTSRIIECLLGWYGAAASEAYVQGFTQDNIPIGSECVLPVISFAQGNSLVFNFRYKDNFGAGYKAVYNSEEKNNMQLVPYGDVYGELYYLKLGILAGGAYAVPRPDIGDMHPVNSNDFLKYCTVQYVNNPLIIRKDSREALSVTIQLHFKANRKSIVVGRLLSNNSSFVKNSEKHKDIAIVFLPYKINMLNPYLDLTLAVTKEMELDRTYSEELGIEEMEASGYINVSGLDRKARINEISCPSDNIKSWAIVDNTTGEYYLGENIDMNTGDKTKPIYFTFTA